VSDPALIFSDGGAPEAPGVHAIVIGVGHYRHLYGGLDDETTMAGVPPVGQLSSPPHSARAMADFLFATYHEDETRPLRTLSMLISEKQPRPYQHILAPDKTIVEATIANIRAAVRAWKARGDSNEDNLLLFYICAHGVSAGLQHTVLASDFARDGGELFAAAIDMTEMRRAMAGCAAQQQVYFVDACRVMAQELLMREYRGDPIIAGDGSVAPRTSPMYRPALAGDAVWASRDAASPFCVSISNAFNGGAWKEAREGWHVSTDLLTGAIRDQFKRLMWKYPSLGSDIDADNCVPMPLKIIDASARPLVPVDIECLPGAANMTVSLQLLPEGTDEPRAVQARDPARDTPWLLDVPMGRYRLTCSFDGNDFATTTVDPLDVSPPSKYKLVEVG